MQSLPTCLKCGGPTKLEKDSSTKFGYIYRCCLHGKKRRIKDKYGRWRVCHDCNGHIAATSNTWFQNVHLPVFTVLSLMFMWILRIPVTMATANATVSTRTVVDWYTYCREVAKICVSHLSHKIGGPSLHVEVCAALIQVLSKLWKFAIETFLLMYS